MKLNFRMGLITLGLIGMVAAADEAVHTFYGLGSIENGQIYRGNTRIVTPLKQAWVQDFGGWLGDSVAVSERTTFRLEIGFGSKVTYNYLIDSTSFANWGNRFPAEYPILSQGYATHVLGDVADRKWSLTFGIFHYKYNPDVNNLGEYLFRSMCYPNFINAMYDFPLARLVGLKISNRLFDGALTSDLLLTSEADVFPYNDISVTLVEGFNIGNFLSIGAGVQGYHLFSIDGNKTNPIEASNIAGDGPGWYYASAQDTATATFAGKRSYYSFSGTKLMGRVNVAPLADAAPIELPFIGRLFGKNDLRFFAEADVLGLKNYPIYSTGDALNPRWVVPGNPKHYEYYNKLFDRIPMTFGINAPTNPLIAYGLIPMAACVLAQDSTLFFKHTSAYDKDTVNMIITTDPITFLPDTTYDTVQVFKRVAEQSLGRLIGIAGSAVLTSGMLILQNKLGWNVSPDLLSFEFEYYSNPWANSYQNVFTDFVPIPESFSLKNTADAAVLNKSLSHNRWRWSVNAEKTLANYFIKLQIAHDHRLAYMHREDLVETADALGAAGTWQWTLKTGVVF